MNCCIETALVQDNIRNPFANILMNDAALVNMHYNKKRSDQKAGKKNGLARLMEQWLFAMC